MSKFKKTTKQKIATRLLASKAKHILLYGGSRSGKSVMLIYALIVRACKTKSRHVALRLKFNHAKTSLWLDTIPCVMHMCFPELEKQIKWNASDFYITFPNGSELWVAGLDDKQRTEKILGKEYSTIFFNESSQIPYASINIALTRLAEKNTLVKKVYYDENPPQKSHWSYSIFILGKDPETWEDRDTSKYASMLMNPGDNLENIDEDYINDVLNNLPPRERDRFLKGEFQDAAEGAIYYAFERDKHIQEFNSKTQPIKVGVDFNVNPITATAAYYENDVIYIFDEIYLKNSNTYALAEEIIKKWGVCDIFPDATGKARKTSAVKTDHEILRDAGLKVQRVANPHVRDRHNCVNGLFSSNKLIVHPRCRFLIKDLEQLVHDNQDPMLDHISDAMGYMCWGLAPLRKVGKVMVNY